jgi:hypothetical protein
LSRKNLFEINGLQRKIDISGPDYQMITLPAAPVDYPRLYPLPTRMELDV